MSHCGHCKQCKCCNNKTLAFVPQDGRREYDDMAFTLRANTTLFHARVNPTKDSGGDAHTVYSHFYGLTLSHPCTVLLQYISKGQNTGAAVIFEYETLRSLKLRRWDYKRYDQVYLPTVQSDTIQQDMRVARAYNIRRTWLERVVPVLNAAGLLNDEALTAIAGRQPDPVLSPGPELHVQRIGPDAFDSDYLHLVQLWTKASDRRMPMEGMALQVALSGARGQRGSLERFAYYLYDTERTFAFKRPIVYRDEQPDVPRAEMPYLVGVAIFYAGWATSSPEQPHQAQCVGWVAEAGYEVRVFAALDRALVAALPLVAGAGSFSFPNTDAALLPQLEAKCQRLGIDLVSE